MLHEKMAGDLAMNDTISIDRGRGSGTLWIRRGLVFILPLLVIIGAIVLVMLMGQLKPKPDEKETEVKALPVLTEMAVTENVTLSVMAQGEVQPRTKINIVPQVSGKISYMSPDFIEGGQFKKGDLLVRIEPAEYKLRVVQARANVAQAETVLTREKSESEIALQDWQELRTGETPSALTLREPQMAEAAARLESAKAQLEEAKLHLNRTSIYAPFTGRVTMRHVDQGEFVTIGNRLGEVYSVAVVDVKIPMTNQDLGRAGLTLGFKARETNPGIPVTLSANVAGRYATWDGEIVRTDSGFDPKTRVLFAYVEVKDPFGAGASDGVPLAPGLFVTADIQGESLPGTVVIPRSGLRGKDQVYVAMSDGTMTIKTVEVASSDRNRAIISSGLVSGASVITSPIRGAAEGMKVDVVERTASADTRSAE